jgi:hypothetical protein
MCITQKKRVTFGMNFNPNRFIYVIFNVFKLPDNISDHDASVVILQCSKNISRSFKREIWQYQKINYEKFEEKLNEIN